MSGLSDVLSTAMEIGSAIAIYKLSHNQAQKHHDIGIRQSEEFHEKGVDLAKRQHLMTMFSELERHFIELESDLVSAIKVCSFTFFFFVFNNFLGFRSLKEICTTCEINNCKP
jgi:hypothetical protein